MIIQKIKEFLSMIFSKNKTLLLEAPKEDENINQEIEQKIDNKFKDAIKADNDDDYRILNLQKEFKKGNIKAEEISEEDTKLLIKLYINQIKGELKEIISYQTSLGNGQNNT